MSRPELPLGAELLSVLDLSPVATTISRVSDGTVLYGNPAARPLLGSDHQGLPGRQQLAARLTAGEVVRDEQQEVGGRTVLTSAFLVDVQGQPAVVALQHDITDRVRQEHQLRRASEAATESSRTKSEFLTAMSHEIRTPLNGVIGMTGLLLQTELSAEQRQYAEIARASGETLLGIVDDLLDFSKIETGRLDLESAEFDLGDLVADVADLLAPTAAAKGLELAVSIDPATPQRVVGDAVRLRQVLLNLASNATRFTEKGSVVLRARPDQDVTRFEVQDTGIGIEPRTLAAIFDSFAQPDSTPGRRFGGTGLGLAICRRLTAMMGGEIGVRSQPGRGSTFWFTCRLPAAEGAAATLQPLAGRRVLVVDELEVTLTVLRAQLRGWGAEVSTTSWAERALDLVHEAELQGRPFDAVLTDADLRAPGGSTLAARLSSVPALRVVVISSLGTGQDGQRPPAGDHVAHLTRPVRPSRLQDVLLELLGDAERRAPAERSAAEQRQGHLLVVDDNATNRIVAEAMLTRRGYTVELAENGRQAVEAVLSGRFDAVLMDCEMPVLDGYAATREIREAEDDARHTRIVALTAAAMAGDAERALAAGMDAYVTKPITLDRLHEELDKVLGLPSAVPLEDDAAGVVDEEPLELLLSLDPSGALVRRVVEVFVHDGPTQTQALREAYAGADLEGVGRASHGLCGMSCAVGAVVVTAQCRALEALARQGALPSADAIEDLIAELDRASRALLGFLDDQVPART